MKIHTVYQSYRKKPYVARWYEGTRQRNRFFSTEKSRAEFIARAERASVRQDATLPDLPPHLLMRWQQAAQLAPEVDPVEVYRFWIASVTKQTSRKNRTLLPATTDYVAAMEQMKRHPAYIGHVRKALADLHEEMGDGNLREITTEQLRAHLFSLPYAALTIRHRRTYLLAAFKWWKKQGWVDENPVTGIDTPEVLDKEPGILTVAETRALFRANEKVDPGICGLLALGAFAGMRSSAIARLDYEEIDFTQRGILTPAEKTKKKRRQWIEDLPENLWEWLRRTPKETFALTERQIRHRTNMAFKRAGLLIEADDISRENAKRARKGESLLQVKPKCPPKNCLRHSFVTYHVALHRNPGKTALIISHRDQDCLYRHYLGIGTKADAAKYFEIRPRK